MAAAEANAKTEITQMHWCEDSDNWVEGGAPKNWVRKALYDLYVRSLVNRLRDIAIRTVLNLQGRIYGRS